MRALITLQIKHYILVDIMYVANLHEYWYQSR